MTQEILSSLLVEGEKLKVESAMGAVVKEALAAGLAVVTDETTTPSLPALMEALDNLFFTIFAANGKDGNCALLAAFTRDCSFLIVR